MIEPESIGAVGGNRFSQPAGAEWRDASTARSALHLCGFVHGQIPSARVLETPEAVAFLDVNPVIRGHTLVVPKIHHAQLIDLPEGLASHIGSLLPLLCRAIQRPRAPMAST